MGKFKTNYYDQQDWQDAEYLLDPVDNSHEYRRNQELAKPEDIDYSKLEKTIVLPKEIKIAKADKIFYPSKKFQKEFQIPQKIASKAQQVKKELQETFMIWDNAKGFKFRFPDSKFEELLEGQVNSLNYQQKFDTEEEDTFKPKLSAQQLAQIARKGQFEVRSNNQMITLPYVWKINEILFKGTETNHKYWLKGLGQIYCIFSRAYRMVRQGIPRQIIVLSKIPKRIFSLIFGKRKHRTIYSVDYHRQVTKDFFNELYDEYYKFDKGWGRQFWTQLFIQYNHQVQKVAQFPKGASPEQITKIQNAKSNQLNKHNGKLTARNNKISQYESIDAQFQSKWAKARKRIIKETSIKIDQKIEKRQKQTKDREEAMLLEQNNEKDRQQIIKEVVQGRKFTLYLTYLKEELPKKKMKEDVVGTIVKLLTLFQLIGIKRKKFNSKLAKKRQQIKSKIQSEHTIRSLSHTFLNNEINKIYLKVEQQMRKEFYNGLLEDQQFLNATSDQQRQIYKRYLKFKSNYNNLILEKKKTIQDLNVPARIFYTTYMLLPPYKIIENNPTYAGGQKSYHMKRTEEMTIDTSHHFWKIKLYMMRIKSWTINCFIFLVGQALLGPFGLRCLIGTQQFQYDQTVNWNQPVIIPFTRKTVIGVFKTVLQGITKSRQSFQATPDRGIFGKKFSRIFNLIECYVFRLVFVGVLIVLIVYPILIILNAVISTVLVLTVWLWVPIIMMVCYIFNVFIFQFESSYIPHGVLIRSVPLASLIFVLARAAVLVVFFIINLLIIAPVRSLAIILFRIFQRVFRGVTDTIMFYLIKFLGRTPSRNTGIAWKISGPGMSKSYFMSIDEQDVYILTQAELEKYYLTKFNQIIQKKIRKHHDYYRNVITTFLAPYVNENQIYYAINNSNIITTNSNTLCDTFNRQYNVFMNRYPRNPYNVRFTQDQIHAYFENSIEIAKNFVKKMDCEDWIFDSLNLERGAYDQLTNIMWTRVFNCGQQIFEPLQKIDSRFKLEDLQRGSAGTMRKHAHSVMNALQGQVKLNRQRANVGHFTPGMNQIDPDIYKLGTMARASTSNSVTGVSINLDDIQSTFFPQMNIKEAIKFDEYTYEYKVKSEQRVIIGNTNRKD